MDFKDSIQQIVERIEKIKDNLQTEEATKMSLIVPMLQALGYDVFNPMEVVPEMTCDVGTKKGEKIDYAILKDGEPMILIECKHWQQNLDEIEQKTGQLLRYFSVSEAKFGILTNGIEYRFYTDLESPNKMDNKPFMTVDLLDLKDSQIEELKKFHKSYFSVDDVLGSAEELKYMNELKKCIHNELSNPSQELVKYFGKQVYNGTFTQKILDTFTPLVKRTISLYINELISSRLKAAISNNEQQEQLDNQKEPEESEPKNQNEKPKIETTDEEKEAYLIVKSIARQVLSVDRIAMRDAQSYCSIFADDNNRRPICRFLFNNTSHKRIAFPGDNNDFKEVYDISTLDDIYSLNDKIIESAKKYA
ncbi:MAG: type I restriction enzyme HsdR N-terminal domain-containing protein [Paludibacteraceae bacterium]|nr:type I restriction enzyme HsdR N-terminal domain-containing protein [Paludibacteraceae bacterium]MBQ6963290.1 type I restriction enzyme HsdR N-terminal domain-containing protein [Paludibacteraceae bacterium]MBQ7747514.1 type I restriction enzyme HsdR N-terminal domain-containing protein [Paludibacteraceae bacterium]